MSIDHAKLIEAVKREVALHWQHEVDLVGVWSSQGAVCAVYRPPSIPDRAFYGRCMTPGPGTADGTLSGMASDFALAMAEPAGTLASRARTDAHGITWFLPTPPPIPAAVEAAIRARRGL